jgi:hypothetical protein
MPSGPTGRRCKGPRGEGPGCRHRPDAPRRTRELSPSAVRLMGTPTQPVNQQLGRLRAGSGGYPAHAASGWPPLVADAPSPAGRPGPRLPAPPARGCFPQPRLRTRELISRREQARALRDRPAQPGRPARPAPQHQGGSKVGQHVGVADGGRPGDVGFDLLFWELAGDLNPQPAVTRQRRTVHGVLLSAVVAAPLGWAVQPLRS